MKLEFLIPLLAVLCALVVGLVLLFRLSEKNSKETSPPAAPQNRENNVSTPAESTKAPRDPVNTPAAVARELTPEEELEIAYFNSLVHHFRKIEKRVNDPLVDEPGLREGLQELLLLRDELDEYLGPPDRRIQGDPRRKLVGEIAKTLRSVQGRLPSDPDLNPVPIVGFPVPLFDTKQALKERASVLREGLQTLARHLRTTDPDKAKTSGLVLDMLKAQEELAWESGWPFTDEEAEQFRQAGSLTNSVYASRLERGVHRINEQLAFERSSAGRGAPPVFALYRPDSGDLLNAYSAHLKEVRGIDEIPAFLRPFDGEAQGTLTIVPVTR